MTTIKKHRDNNSLAPNLLALVNIAKNNPPLLERINYDIDQTEQAHYLSHKVSEYLALVNVSNNSQYESKLWRDRAYTLLYKRMNNIRVCGQYVFHNNKKKYKQYVSEYYREYNTSNRKPKTV